MIVLAALAQLYKEHGYLSAAIHALELLAVYRKARLARTPSWLVEARKECANGEQKRAGNSRLKRE